MGFMSQYNIPIKGIRDGIHFFDVTVEDKFFESFGKEEILGGKVDVKVELKKTSLLTSIKFSFIGTVNVPCDRCLDNFDFPFSSDYELFIKYSDNEQEDDDKIIFLKSDEHEINLFPYIFELIELSLPLKKVHADKTDGSQGCNKEMLKYLEKHLTNDKKDNKSQWDKLKMFLNN